MSDRIDNSTDERPGLARQLGVASMAALLIGITIGSGIFRVPSTVASELGSVGGVAFVWLCGALITLAGAIPLASLARAFAPLTDAQVHLVAGALIVTLGAANIRSVRWSATLQNVSTVAKVVVLAALALVIFGAVHSRGRTPYVALLLYMSLGLAGDATRTFEQLAEIFVMGIWPFYALGVGAIFLVPRRRPELARLRRSFGYPVLPAAFILVSAVMLANAAVRRPVEMAISAGIVALGIPAYFLWRATQRGHVSALPPAADAAQR
jgi:amino acid transporter